MRLIDTSAWIEWLLSSPVGVAVEPLLPERDAWLVPTIVQLELAKWGFREMDEDRTEKIIAFSQKCVIVPLDTNLALSAATMGRTLNLPMADAIVYATAMAYGAEVITCGAHFDGLEGVTYLAKTAGRD